MKHPSFDHVTRPKVEVLTEERDVARSHEEELFAKLAESTDDLEALQESYVSLTDRYFWIRTSRLSNRFF